MTACLVCQEPVGPTERYAGAMNDSPPGARIHFDRDCYARYESEWFGDLSSALGGAVQDALGALATRERYGEG